MPSASTHDFVRHWQAAAANTAATEQEAASSPRQHNDGPQYRSIADIQKATNKIHPTQVVQQTRVWTARPAAHGHRRSPAAAEARAIKWQALLQSKQQLDIQREYDHPRALQAQAANNEQPALSQQQPPTHVPPNEAIATTAVAPTDDAKVALELVRNMRDSDLLTRVEGSANRNRVGVLERTLELLIADKPPIAGESTVEEEMEARLALLEKKRAEENVRCRERKARNKGKARPNEAVATTAVAPTEGVKAALELVRNMRHEMSRMMAELERLDILLSSSS